MELTYGTGPLTGRGLGPCSGTGRAVYGRGFRPALAEDVVEVLGPALDGHTP